MSSRRAANYPNHCETSEDCHGTINCVFHMRTVQALLSDALGWSSEKWSKASGRTTAALDQVRTRLPMSIPTLVDYVKRDAKTTARLLQLVMWRTKSAGAKSHPDSYGKPEV